MNKTAAWVIVAVLVIGGLWYTLSHRGPDDEANSQTVPVNSETPSNPSASATPAKATKQLAKIPVGQGQVVFSITDAATDMTGIGEIMLKVNKLEMYSAASGWVVVPPAAKTYNLLNLNARNVSEYMADIGAKPSTYTKLRLTLGGVMIQNKDGKVTSAKLPSSVINIGTSLVLTANKLSSLNFDFMADKSLVTTTDGGYIFAPVVKTEAKSGQSLTVNEDGTVEILGGQNDYANVVGMDIDGSTKVNFQIDSSKTFSIDSKGFIKMNSASN